MSARILDDDPACLDAAHALLDEAGAETGPLVERVRNALECLDNAKHQIGRLTAETAATNTVLDDIGARVGPLADRVKSFGSETDDFINKLRSQIKNARRLRDMALAERDAARDARNEAHALLTAALPHLERFPRVLWDGDVLTRVRAWLGVCDG